MKFQNSFKIILKLLLFAKIAIIITAILFIQNSSLTAQDKIIDWDSIHVDAYIDEDGSMLIHEVQSIRFTGDWNGGYRNYDLGWGQKFDFISIERKNADGEWIELQEGDLNYLDHYTWIPSKKQVRWRSRNPSDPIFENTVIQYRITGRYHRILDRISDGTYKLDHDFGFADRYGDIRQMSVDLSWHENWEPLTLSSLEETEKLIRFSSDSRLAPGQKMICKTELKFRGSNPDILPPSGLIQYMTRLLYIILLVGALAGIQYLIFIYSNKKGVFAKPEKIRNWQIFKTTLGDLSPEDIAILSEKGIVSAWMTRLFFENKISTSKMNKKAVTLKKMVEDSDFTELDQKIIPGLFVDNKTEVTTKDIKNYYKNKQASYSLHSEIERVYRSSLLERGILKEKKSFLVLMLEFLFTKVFFKIIFFIPFVLIISGVFYYFIESSLEQNGISSERFFISLVVVLFSFIVISVIEDEHYGFDDLERNRTRYFYTRYLRSLIPSIFIIGFYFWSLDLSNEVIYLCLSIMALISIRHMVHYSPHNFIDQINWSLKALSLKNFLSDKLSSDDECDIPAEYSSYIPAFDLTFDLEYRIKHRKKKDCLYLLPENFSNFQIDSIHKSDKTHSTRFHSPNSIVDANSSSGVSTSGAKTGTKIGGGGLFAGAGAAASWSDMNDFSSSSVYTPPSRSSSSSGSSSSGGGGGGGW